MIRGKQLREVKKCDRGHHAAGYWENQDLDLALAHSNALSAASAHRQPQTQIHKEQAEGQGEGPRLWLERKGGPTGSQPDSPGSLGWLLWLKAASV